MTPKWQENKEVALKRPGSQNGWLLNWMDIHPRRAIQHPAIPSLCRKGKTGQALLTSKLINEEKKSGAD